MTAHADAGAAAPAALQVLRPEGTDSASIAAAIARGEAAEVEARANAEKAKENWGAMLLSAGDAEMEELERATAKFLRDADRIAAALPQLRQDLAAATKREAREAAIRLIEEANAAGERFMKRWREEYLQLATGIASILGDEVGARAAWRHARLAGQALPEDDQVGLPELLEVATELFDGPVVAGELIQLPNVDGTLGGGPWFDPRRPVRSGSAAGSITRDRQDREARAREKARHDDLQARRRRIEAVLQERAGQGVIIPQSRITEELAIDLTADRDAEGAIGARS